MKICEHCGNPNFEYRIAENGNAFCNKCDNIMKVHTQCRPSTSHDYYGQPTSGITEKVHIDYEIDYWKGY